MKQAKKIVSLFLTLVMCAGFMSLSAFADFTLPGNDDLNAVINFNDYTATTDIDAPNANFNVLTGNELNVNNEVTLEGGAVFSTEPVATLDDNTKFWGKWEAEFVMIPSQDIPSGTVTAYGQYDNYKEGVWVGIELGENIPAGTTVRVIKDALPNDFKDMIAGALGKEVSALNGIPFAVVAYAVQTFQCGLDVLDYTKLVPGTSVDLELRLYAPRELTVAELTAVGAINGVTLKYDSALGLYYLLIGETNTFNFPVEDNYVARVGDKNYKTLAEAVAAVPNDGTETTITMLQNHTAGVTFDDAVKIDNGKNIVLDLGGKTLTARINLYEGKLDVKNGTISNSGKQAINVYATNDSTKAAGAYNSLTLESSATLAADYGIILRESTGNTGYGSEITIDGTINGVTWIMGNIHQGNSEIHIGSHANLTGVDTSDGDTAIGLAMAGYAIVDVADGASLTGQTGLEVRAGKLTVNGGTFTGTEHPNASHFNNNGTTVVGAALAVSSYDNSDIDVKVKGGTFNGYIPFVETRTKTITKTVQIAIEDGVFVVTNSGTNSVKADNETQFITGGYYSTEPDTSYLAEDYTTQYIGSGTYNGYYKVLSGTPVAEVDGVQYVDLQDAIDAAKDGDIIHIIANFTIDSGKTAATDRIVVDKAVTIDFGEYTMTVPGELEPTRNWSALYVDADVTITGTTGGIHCADKTNPTGGCGVYAVTVRNGANLTIDGGVYHGGGSTVYVIQGCATINGGTFTATTFEDPYGMEFLLNCLDKNYQNGTAGINVKGGIFTSYNPSESVSEYPHANFVATGYKVDHSGDIYTVVLDTNKYTAVTTTTNTEVQTETESDGNTITDTFVKATSGEADFAEVAYAIKVETKNTSTSEVTSTVYNPVAAAVTTTSDVNNVDSEKVDTAAVTDDAVVTAKVTEIKDTLTSFTASVAASSDGTSVNILNTTAASNAIAAAAAQTDVADKSAIAEVEVQLNTKLKGYTIASTGTVEKVIYDVKPVAVVKNESGTQIGDAVTLTNADLAAQNLTLTFTLPVPDDLVDTTQGTPYVKVTHTHENNTSDWKLYEVKGSAGDYYIESESGDFSTFTLEKVVLEATGENALVAYQLTLDGSVGADFYITLNSNVAYYSNAKIRLTPVRVGSGVNTQTSTAKEYKVSELTALPGVTINGRPVYNVYFKTYAKELYDKINIELVDAGSEKFTGVIAGHDWLQSGKYAISVIDLAQYMYNADGVSAKGKTLAKALENFGYYTTKYLNYYTNPAAPAFDAGTIPAYTTPGDGELGAALDSSGYLTYSGQLLNMSAETGLRMVFEPSGTYTKDDFTFTIDRGNGEETLAMGRYDSTRFYVLLPNVASSDLNRVFSITIKCEGVTVATFTRSAMNWVYNIHVPGNESNLNYQFAEALRQYNLAADAYFES